MRIEEGTDEEYAKQETGRTIEATPLPQSNRGRPRKWDWDRILAEVVLLANTPDGLPNSQAELERFVMEHCQETYGHEPAPSLIRQKIAPIYQKLRQ